MGNVLTGARVSESLIKEVKVFCQRHGLKLSYFVTQALREKLSEITEEEKDLALFNARESESDISEEEMNHYLKSRGLNV